jgi:hypothetical protein
LYSNLYKTSGKTSKKVWKTNIIGGIMKILDHKSEWFIQDLATGALTKLGEKFSKFKVGERRVVRYMDPHTMQPKTFIREFVDCGDGTGKWVRI